MRFVKSHGRLLTIFGIICLPVGMAAGAGYWFSEDSHERIQKEDTEQRLGHLSTQTQLLTDLLLEEIEGIRTQSLGLAMARSAANTPIPRGKILHWMEVETQGQALKTVRQAARNPLWNASEVVEKSYIQSALSYVRLNEVKRHGMGVLRVQSDPGGASEWLSFAFPSDVSQDSLVLALVDPEEAFLSFSRFSAISKSGHVRAYLIGNDGRVLAHSQKSYRFSDFSKTSVFQNLASRVIDGTILKGHGQYLGIEQWKIDAASFRVGLLPLAVVIEHFIGTSGGTSGLVSGAADADSFRFSAASFLLFLGLALGLFSAVLFCAWILRARLVQTVTITVREPHSDQVAQETVAFSTRNEKKKASFFKGDEMLILSTENKTEAERGHH